MTFAALDVETTGLDPRRGRVCEVAIVRFRGDGTFLDEYATLIDPGRPIRGTDVHGITAEDVAGAPTFPEAAPDILRLLSGCVVVAHNLTFEDGFLAAELDWAGYHPRPALAGLCTLVACRAQLDGPSYKLMSLYRTVTGQWVPDAHTALGDGRALAVLVPWLLANAPAPLRYYGPLPHPRSGVLAAPGRIAPRAARLSQGADGYLGALAKRFPATRADHPVDPVAERAYAAALDEVIADQRITGEEVGRMERLARRAGLNQQRLIDAHRRAWLRATADDPLDAPETMPVRRRRALVRLARDLGHPQLAAHLTVDGNADDPPATTYLKGWRVGIDGAGPGLDDLAALVTGNGGAVAKRLTATARFVAACDPAADTPLLAKARDLGLTILPLPDARARVERALAVAASQAREQARREAEDARRDAEDDAYFRHRWRRVEEPPVWGWEDRAITVTLPRA